MSLTYNLFLSLQKRISEKLDDFFKIEQKKKKLFQNLNISQSTNFLDNNKISKIQKFYKDQDYVLKEVVHNLTSTDNNLIKNKTFIDKIQTFLRYAQKKQEFIILIKSLEAYLYFCSKNLGEIDKISTKIINCENSIEIINLVKDEKVSYDKVKDRTCEFVKETMDELDRLEYLKVINFKDVKKKISNNIDIARKKGNTSVAIMMSISILSVMGFLGLISTEGFTEKPSIHRTKESVKEMYYYMFKGDVIEEIIELPELGFGGKVNLRKQKIIYQVDNSRTYDISQLRPSKRCIDMIKDFEKLRLKSYLCAGKVWTIGYGHTENVRRGMKISRYDAERLLQQDLVEFQRALKKHIRVPLTQNQYDALLSFIFNIGEEQFASSTLLKQLNSGQYDLAANELLRWKYSKKKVLAGLVKRRSQERELFLENS